MHTLRYKSMEFVKMYKIFILSVRGKCINCTMVYKATFLEGIQMIFKNSLAHFPLPMIENIPQTHYLMAHPSHAFFFTSCMFIQLPTPPTMNRNINWVQIFPFSLSHDNGNMVNPLICTHCIIGLLFGEILIFLKRLGVFILWTLHFAPCVPTWWCFFSFILGENLIFETNLKSPLFLFYFYKENKI